MITFYIIGVVLALLLFITISAWEIANGDIDEIDIPLRIKGIFLVSLFSWLYLFFAVMLAFFNRKQ